MEGSKAGDLPSPGDHEEGKKASILVADDDELLSHILSMQLTQKGYEVVTASDGATAISCIDQGQIQLAVLDIMMPSLNGFGVLRHIKE